ncbi:MAG TPA: GntR family transcriptional regulator [Pirellulales bacterium]|nr:GntR family transcriptional regulator [Pirellulales bacterium]
MPAMALTDSGATEPRSNANAAVPPSPAKKTLLKDTAYQKLKESILSGQFPPGSFLAERQLTGLLGMSKTPIRAALEHLESEGLVSVSPQQGIVVREISPREIFDVFDIRHALEPHVARSLAARHADEQIGQLKSHLAIQEVVYAQNRVLEATRLDREFHMLLCGLHGNCEIIRVLDHVWDKIFREVVRILGQKQGRMLASIEEHRAIVDAIASGDCDSAQGKMVDHIHHTKRFFSFQ